MGNIVQIVYDEKDARSYLETLANKMGEELENLRMAKNSQLPLQKHIQTVSQSANQSAGNPLMPIDNGQGNDSEKWRTLRKNKVKNQQILELQSTLQEEIQLRHQINTDLTMERQNNQDRILKMLIFVRLEPQYKIQIKRLEHENIELKAKIQELLDSVQTTNSLHEHNSLGRSHFDPHEHASSGRSSSPVPSLAHSNEIRYKQPQLLPINDPRNISL